MPDLTCLHPRCGVARSEMMDVPLCDRHAIDIYRRVRDAIESGGRSALRRSVMLVPKDLTNQNPPSTARPLWASTSEGTVYFIEFRDRIKIGFTTNLKRRLTALPHERVLATMPGTYADEQRLHTRFRATRTNGEWFEKSPDLLAFIEHLAA